ncbi:hypothetical protein Daus18300_011511 [Diaporthe australafricana]|uniref:HAD-superfamily subfamily IIA hydrolase n=1 Tax=Diaporthe australafricana TaxID=127596 RepID=A0ABR3W6C1_9PEZI
MADEPNMLPEECPPALPIDQISLIGNRHVIPDLQNVTHNFAFAFDIDGVLVRGKAPLHGAKQALETLQANAIPFILLTNGGGLTEADHAERVGQRLDISIREDQFVQSHSPFQSFVDEFQDKWILVLGGQKSAAKELATHYAFSPNKIVSSSDLVKDHPSIHPFPEMTASYHGEHGKVAEDFSHEKEIAAIFVFSSPRDWCLDLQVCLDLLLSSRGRLGTESALNGDTTLPNNGYQQDNQPRLFWCNPDVQWATSHATPRLAQGGFRAALEGIWKSVTKGKAELNSWTCGKPTSTTYDFAEQVLKEYNGKLQASGATKTKATKLKTVYMIGDNPESDICGAMVADKVSDLTWRSVLIETGVHKAGTTPAYEPTETKSDVWGAVRWAINKETDVDIGERTDV